MSFKDYFETKQKDAREQVLKMAKKSLEDTNFYIDDVRVDKEQYLKALEAEDAYKLPFAYSKHTVTFYLLTKKYLSEGRK